MLKTEKTGRMQNEIVTILLENVGEAPEINRPLAEMLEDVSVFDPSGREKVGEAQVRREDRRDVFPVVFLCKKTQKNKKHPLRRTFPAVNQTKEGLVKVAFHLTTL